VKTDLSADSKFSPASPQIKSLMAAPVQFELMIAAHRRMVEKIGVINKHWLTSVRESSNAGSDLAMRLWRCDNPVDGASLCNDWFRGSADRLVSEGLSAMELWMEFCSAAFGTPTDVDVTRRQSPEEGEPGQEKKPASTAA
jgi:hypothetical protein